MAADDRLLGVALAPVGQLLALAHRLVDDALDDPLGDDLRAPAGRLAATSAIGVLGLFLLVGEELAN